MKRPHRYSCLVLHCSLFQFYFHTCMHVLQKAKAPTGPKNKELRPAEWSTRSMIKLVRCRPAIKQSVNYGIFFVNYYKYLLGWLFFFKSDRSCIISYCHQPSFLFRASGAAALKPRSEETNNHGLRMGAIDYAHATGQREPTFRPISLPFLFFLHFVHLELFTIIMP